MDNNKLPLHELFRSDSAQQDLVDLVVDLDKLKPHKPQDLDSAKLHNQRDLVLIRRHNQPLVDLDLDKQHSQHSQQDSDLNTTPLHNRQAVDSPHKYRMKSLTDLLKLKL